MRGWRPLSPLTLTSAGTNRRGRRPSSPRSATSADRPRRLPRASPMAPWSPMAPKSPLPPRISPIVSGRPIPSPISWPCSKRVSGADRCAASIRPRWLCPCARSSTRPYPPTLASRRTRSSRCSTTSHEPRRLHHDLEFPHHRARPLLRTRRGATPQPPCGTGRPRYALGALQPGGHVPLHARTRELSAQIPPHRRRGGPRRRRDAGEHPRRGALDRRPRLARPRRPHHQRLRGVRRRYQGTTGGPPMSSDNPGQDSAVPPDRGAGSPHQGEDSPHREGSPHLEAALALARAKSSLDTAIGTMLSRVGLSLEDLRRLRLIGARPQGLGREDLAEAMGEPRSHAVRSSL